MKKPPTPTSDPQILAVLHRTGRTWRAVVGSNRTGQPELIAARDFPQDRAGRIDEWLNEQNAGTVVCVLPAGSVICRTFPLPDAPADQLEQALRLQAEAHLLGIAPPHRLAMAVLPAAAGETTRTGLVLAWPESAVVPVPPTTRRLEFAPDVGAMATLLNGHRPNDAVMWLDREDGSVALAIAHSGGVIFRATREEAASSEEWQRNVGRIAAETALSVGHTGAFVDALARAAQASAGELRPSESRLFLPLDMISALAARANGLATDLTWWPQFGVAVGALLARLEGGEMATLTRLLQSPPVETPSPVIAAAQKLSRPHTAALVIGACILVAMFSPLVFAAARLGILKWRFGDVHTQLVAATTVKHQISMYRELQNQHAWSMTKLLSDVAVYTPIGIEIESIRIEGGKDFILSGTAIANENKTPAQVVAQMQDNLRADGMFTDIVVNAGKSDNLGRYKFDLSAKVVRPYSHPPLPEELDFARTPYAVRLYGEAARSPGASSSAIASAADRTNYATQQTPPARVADSRSSTSVPPRVAPVQPDPAPRDDAAASGGNPRIGMAGAGEPPIGTGDDLAVNPRPVPPPLNPEQIKVMSEAELKDALAKVGKARNNSDLDKETKDRLKIEFDLIMEQLKKIKAS